MNFVHSFQTEIVLEPNVSKQIFTLRAVEMKTIFGITKVKTKKK